MTTILLSDAVLDFFDSTELGFGERKIAVFLVVPDSVSPAVFVFYPYLACDRYGQAPASVEMYC